MTRLRSWLWRMRWKALDFKLQEARMEYLKASREMLEHESEGRKPRKPSPNPKLWKVEEK